MTLATLHSSKGTGVFGVFLVDVNEGVIPHSKAFLEARSGGGAQTVLRGNDKGKRPPALVLY